MRSPIWIFQHLDAEPAGVIANVLRHKGHPLSVLHWDRQQPPRDLMREARALVVMGGPMGVYEEAQYPWMTTELQYLRQALELGMPILGMCLGSQLLAAAAGAKVYPGGRPKELGWGPITLTENGLRDPLCRALRDAQMGEAPVVFHWHGDTFDLPVGAQLLASTALYPHQAMRVGKNAYGFQFHVEVTEDIIRTWVGLWHAELEAQGQHPAAILDGMPRYLAVMNRRAEAIVRCFSDLVEDFATRYQPAPLQAAEVPKRRRGRLADSRV